MINFNKNSVFNLKPIDVSDVMRRLVKEDLLKLVPPGSARRGIFEDDIENGEVEIGQIASAIKEVLPVAEVMKRLVDEFQTVKEKSANF